MKILNFGSCNIDYMYKVDHIVVPGETIHTYGLEIFPGGKGLNQSIAAAKAGAEVYHAGCVGEDSEILRDILLKSGVDISFLKDVEGKNGHAIIQVSKTGENSIFLYRGSNEMITEEFVDEVLEKFSSDDIILLQNEINNIEYIIKKAYSKGMKIVLNPSPISEELKKIDFNMLSFLILNEVEAKCFTGKEEAEEHISYFKNNYPDLKVILTLGKNGCIFSDNENTFYQPAYKVHTVDTTAAGDTFTGYFISAISFENDYKKALRIASAASALSVSKEGAAPSIPDKKDVYNNLKELKPYTFINSDKAEYQKKEINKYIEENLKTACLDGLAKRINYSAAYTSELIKKLMNMSFSELLQNKRCSIAANMLRDTDLSVSEIINATGYENESFFRKLFKEKYGKLPYEYRKYMRGMKQ